MITTERKTNVMFVMADQLRFDALNNPQVLTPNIDKLREEAIFMNNFYSNTPVCVPSRCCIATGRYPHSTRVRENHTLLEDNREIHIFRAMKQAGYSIAYSGKNHLLCDDEFENFDYAVTEENAQKSDKMKQLKTFNREKAAEVGSYGYRCASYHELGIEGTSASYFTDRMVDYISNYDFHGNNPFFCFLSIVEPHYPHIVPKEIWDMYEGVEFELPKVFEDDLDRKSSSWRVKQQSQHADEATYEEKQRYLRAYYSFVTLYDMQVGRIVEVLKQKNIWDDTLLMVTTDHGEYAWNHCLYKKNLVLQEDLLHIPMIVSLPWGVTGEVDAMAEQVDIMPTILEACGLDVPFGVQGHSMLPMLTGLSDEHKEAVYGEICPPWLHNPFDTYEKHLEYWESQGKDKISAPFNVPGEYCKSIRTKHYRYVWYGNGDEELYDLLNDPGECHNLLWCAEGDSVPEDIINTGRELKMRLLEWNAISEDPLDPRLIGELQKKYDCWKVHDRGNLKGWLPFWVELLTDFDNSRFMK